MTRNAIARSIAEDLGLTQLETKTILQKVFDAILDTLVAEERVEALAHRSGAVPKSS